MSACLPPGLGSAAVVGRRRLYSLWEAFLAGRFNSRDCLVIKVSLVADCLEAAPPLYFIIEVKSHLVGYGCEFNAPICSIVFLTLTLILVSS